MITCYTLRRIYSLLKTIAGLIAVIASELAILLLLTL